MDRVRSAVGGFEGSIECRVVSDQARGRSGMGARLIGDGDGDRWPVGLSVENQLMYDYCQLVIGTVICVICFGYGWCRFCFGRLF